MPEKLLTMQELSHYLGVSEEKITSLVAEGVISGYHIGGELLRFRKEQIDAIRTEIETRITDKDRVSATDFHHRVKRGRLEDNTLSDRIADFIYFNDFYILASVLIVLLILLTLKG